MNGRSIENSWQIINLHQSILVLNTHYSAMKNNVVYFYHGWCFTVIALGFLVCCVPQTAEVIECTRNEAEYIGDLC